MNNIHHVSVSNPTYPQQWIRRVEGRRESARGHWHLLPSMCNHTQEKTHHATSRLLANWNTQPSMNTIVCGSATSLCPS